MSRIEDGKGKGFLAQVDERNRLKISGITESESVFAAKLGDAYNINTGYITIGGGVGAIDSSLLYIKNNEDKDFVITALAIGVAPGNAAFTAGEPFFLTLVRNPENGDIVTDETPVDMNENRNFGSSNALVADVYKGKSGGTITGGDDIAILQLVNNGRSFFTIDFFLRKGSSIAVKLTSDISSGSCQIYCAAIGYLLDPNI